MHAWDYFNNCSLEGKNLPLASLIHAYIHILPPLSLLFFFFFSVSKDVDEMH